MAPLILNLPKMLPSVFASESISADEFFVHWMCRGARAEQQSHPSSIELIWLALLFCILIALHKSDRFVGRLWVPQTCIAGQGRHNPPTVKRNMSSSLAWKRKKEKGVQSFYSSAMLCTVYLCLVTFWPKNRHYSDNIRRHLLGKRIT